MLEHGKELVGTSKIIGLRSRNAVRENKTTINYNPSTDNVEMIWEELSSAKYIKLHFTAAVSIYCNEVLNTISRGFVLYIACLESAHFHIYSMYPICSKVRTCT